jgi:hypothetical protein
MNRELKLYCVDCGNRVHVASSAYVNSPRCVRCVCRAAHHQVMLRAATVVRFKLRALDRAHEVHR